MRTLLPTTKPGKCNLVVVVSILSNILLNLPFKQRIDSVCSSLRTKHGLKRLRVIVGPGFFSSDRLFHRRLDRAVHRLGTVAPTPNFGRICCPKRSRSVGRHGTTIRNVRVISSVCRCLVSSTLCGASCRAGGPFTRWLLERSFLVVARFHRTVRRALP